MFIKDRSIRFLLISILLVGLFIVVQENWRKRTPQRVYDQIKVFDLNPSALTLLRFESTNSIVECEKESGVWMVGDSEGNKGRADLALLLKLIVDLDSLGKGTTITAKQLKLRGIDASEYGFNPPTMEVTAVDNRGRTTWEIGRITPTEMEVYVREKGKDEIYTIHRSFWDMIPEKPGDLRNRTLFTGDAAGVRSLEIRGDSGFVRIVKEASGSWRIQQPIEAAADPYEVVQYIQNLLEIRIEDFIAENVSDLSAYGLQSGTRQISLSASDGVSSALIIGDSIPGRPGLLYARRADDTSVFALKEAVLKFFVLPENPFRDARVLTMDPGKITAIRLQYNNEQLDLSMDDQGEWKITNPVVWDADREAVAELIDLWGKAVITDYDLAAGTAVTEWTLEFISGDGATTNRVEVLARGGAQDGLLIRLNQDRAIHQINLPIVPNSIIDPLVYKDKRIWSLARNDISKLMLQRSGGEQQVVERLADGTFGAVGSSGNAHVDESSVNRVINRLCSLQTAEYIDYNPRDSAIYGLDDPSVELYVGLSNADQLGRVLLIGHESTEGYYSMVKGRDVVFYLDPATVEILESDLVSKPEGSMLSQ